MTRAIRFAAVILLGLALVGLPARAFAQNYPNSAAGPQQAQQRTPAPQRASVYGPALGTQAQPQQAQANPQYPNAQVAQQQPLGPQQGVQIQPAVGQQPIRQPGAGVGQGANPLDVPKVAVVPPGPIQPEWYPLDPKVQEWVDQVLAYWEKRSDQVKTLECSFQKWEYDPQQIPNVVQQLQIQGQLHTLPFTKYAAGVIKYAAPDKGLFRVEQLQTIDAAQAGAAPKYKVQPKENGEHWVCDGKRVFAFDALRKEVIESQLPPEMQGKALMDGPLPFMFGARAETIKARYWIRPLQAEAAGEYCLEAVPKSRQDAANFKSVQIVLDEKEYLPVKMQIFEADFSPKNPHRTAYKFDKRVVNSDKIGVIPAVLNPLQLNLNPWAREFYEVKAPNGWRHIIRDANGNTVAPGGTATNPAPPAAPKATQR